MQDSDTAIIIVTGLPRSGTSMMMRMLEAGGIPTLTDNLRPADDDNPHGYYEFERVKQIKTDTSWLDAARGHAVKMVYLLLYDLPGTYTYKVIFMQRNIGEVIASQEAMLIRRGEGTGRLTREQMAMAYQEHLKRVGIWLDSQQNFEVLYVDYNAILNNPGEQINAVARFLGNTLDIDAMTGIIDPSLYRQRH